MQNVKFILIFLILVFAQEEESIFKNIQRIQRKSIELPPEDEIQIFNKNEQSNNEIKSIASYAERISQTFQDDENMIFLQLSTKKVEPENQVIQKPQQDDIPPLKKVLHKEKQNQEEPSQLTEQTVKTASKFSLLKKIQEYKDLSLEDSLQEQQKLDEIRKIEEEEQKKKEEIERKKIEEENHKKEEIERLKNESIAKQKLEAQQNIRPKEIKKEIFVQGSAKQNNNELNNLDYSDYIAQKASEYASNAEEQQQQTISQEIIESHQPNGLEIVQQKIQENQKQEDKVLKNDKLEKLEQIEDAKLDKVFDKMGNDINNVLESSQQNKTVTTNENDKQQTVQQQQPLEPSSKRISISEKLKQTLLKTDLEETQEIGNEEKVTQEQSDIEIEQELDSEIFKVNNDKATDFIQKSNPEDQNNDEDQAQNNQAEEENNQQTNEKQSESYEQIQYDFNNNSDQQINISESEANDIKTDMQQLNNDSQNQKSDDKSVQQVEYQLNSEQDKQIQNSDSVTQKEQLEPQQENQSNEKNNDKEDLSLSKTQEENQIQSKKQLDQEDIKVEPQIEKDADLKSDQDNSQTDQQGAIQQIAPEENEKEKPVQEQEKTEIKEQEKENEDEDGSKELLDKAQETNAVEPDQNIQEVQDDSNNTSINENISKQENQIITNDNLEQHPEEAVQKVENKEENILNPENEQQESKEDEQTNQNLKKDQISDNNEIEKKQDEVPANKDNTEKQMDNEEAQDIESSKSQNVSTNQNEQENKIELPKQQSDNQDLPINENNDIQAQEQVNKEDDPLQPQQVTSKDDQNKQNEQVLSKQDKESNQQSEIQNDLQPEQKSDEKLDQKLISNEVNINQQSNEEIVQENQLQEQAQPKEIDDTINPTKQDQEIISEKQNKEDQQAEEENENVVNHNLVIKENNEVTTIKTGQDVKEQIKEVIVQEEDPYDPAIQEEKQKQQQQQKDEELEDHYNQVVLTGNEFIQKPRKMEEPKIIVHEIKFEKNVYEDDQAYDIFNTKQRMKILLQQEDSESKLYDVYLDYESDIEDYNDPKPSMFLQRNQIDDDNADDLLIEFVQKKQRVVYQDFRNYNEENQYAEYEQEPELIKSEYYDEKQELLEVYEYDDDQEKIDYEKLVNNYWQDVPLDEDVFSFQQIKGRVEDYRLMGNPIHQQDQISFFQLPRTQNQLKDIFESIKDEIIQCDANYEVQRVCDLCQSENAYEINEDNWYLIGLAYGLKRNFQNLLTTLREHLKYSKIYTSFTQNQNVCIVMGEQIDIENIHEVIQKYFNNTLSEYTTNPLVQIPQKVIADFLQIRVDMKNYKYSDMEMNIQIPQSIKFAGVEISNQNLQIVQEHLIYNQTGYIQLPNNRAPYQLNLLLEPKRIRQNYYENMIITGLPIKSILSFPVHQEYSKCSIFITDNADVIEFEVILQK